ncbi:hypothetical protein M758_UG330000 [Ceratodon purpureus]|nr:hypothetical protein M758_UG330000 [Ceratodon purpureus]
MVKRSLAHKPPLLQRSIAQQPTPLQPMSKALANMNDFLPVPDSSSMITYKLSPRSSKTMQRCPS